MKKSRIPDGYSTGTLPWIRESVSRPEVIEAIGQHELLSEDELDDLLVELYRHYSPSKIGRWLRVTPTTVRGHLRRLGVKIRPRGGANNVTIYIEHEGEKKTIRQLVSEYQKQNPSLYPHLLRSRILNCRKYKGLFRHGVPLETLILTPKQRGNRK